MIRLIIIGEGLGPSKYQFCLICQLLFCSYLIILLPASILLICEEKSVQGRNLLLLTNSHASFTISKSAKTELLLFFFFFIPHAYVSKHHGEVVELLHCLFFSGLIKPLFCLLMVISAKAYRLLGHLIVL